MSSVNSTVAPPAGCPYHKVSGSSSSGATCTFSSYFQKLTTTTGLAISASSALVGAATLAYKYYRKYYANGSIFPVGDQRRVDETVFDMDDVEVQQLLSDNTIAQQFYLQTPFTYVQLAHGRVRYQLRHPPAGVARKVSPLVVFSHGYSIPADIWKPVADLLLQDGHSVLTFDLFGRGFSDAPDGQQFDDRFFVSQLAQLLYALNITEKIDLIGVSMGGAIVTAFATTYPDKVNRLGIVCTAGLPINAPGWIPIKNGNFLTEYMFVKLAPEVQDRGHVASWEKKDTPVYNAWKKFYLHTLKKHPGFLRSIHSSVKHFPMEDMNKHYDILAQDKNRDILVIWGENDSLTPYANFQTLLQKIPHAQGVTIVQAKHNMLIERPAPIAAAISEWLKDSKKKVQERRE